MVRNKRLENKAYNYIEQKIKAKEWRPKEHLKEMELAQELNMSRTPIRNALKRLEQERVIRIEPYKGAVILEPKVDKEAFQERTQFLELIITYHFQKLELREQDYQNDELDVMLEKLEQLITKKDAEQTFEDYEIDVWLVILKYCENNYMRNSIVTALREIFPSRGHIHNILMSSRQEKVSHYQKMIDFLKAGNYPYARREVRILINKLNMNVLQGVS